MQVDFIAKSMTPAEAHLELYGKTELIANKVIEIEEEIDAISPSLEHGRWEFINAALGSDGSPGKFTLRKSDNSLCEMFVDVGKVEVSATRR